MAKIPTIDVGGAQISTESPQAKLDPQVSSTGGRMFFELGKGMEEVSSQIEKAQSLAESTKASNIAAAQMAVLKNKQALDQDISKENQLRYHQEADDIYRNASQNISLPYNRDIFMTESKSKVSIDKIDMSTIARKRMIDNAQADFLLSKENMGHRYININPNSLTAPIQREMYIHELNHLLDKKVAAGFMTKEEAAKDRIEIPKKWVRQLIQKEVYSDPEGFLKRESEGKYSGAEIDAQNMGAFRTTAENVIKRRETQAKETQKIHVDSIVDDLYQRGWSGALTGPQLEEQQGIIPESAFNQLEKMTSSSVGPTAGTNNDTYLEITKALRFPPTGENPQKKIERIRTMIANANIEGKLSLEDGQKLYQMHLIPSKADPVSMADSLGQQQTSDDFVKLKKDYDAYLKGIEDKNNHWKPVMDLFAKAFTGPKKTSDIVNATKKLIDIVLSKGVKNKDILSEAEKIVAEKNIQINPNVFSQASDNGTDGWDRFGPVTVYKNGRVVRKK